MARTKFPLLLVDNKNILSVINEGEFKFSPLTFVEAKSIIDMHDEDDVINLFSGRDLEKVVYNYLDVEDRNFEYMPINNMVVGQDAIIFKLYITPSETQPIITTESGAMAKKIENIYVTCQLVSRIK
ncbi:MAG: hypothetical protein IK955_00420 [Clostridia bacterium]|nr:hypothetical protein [Clostridia bacterium]